LGAKLVASLTLVISQLEFRPPQERESPKTITRMGLAKEELASVSIAIRKRNFFICFRRVTRRFDHLRKRTRQTSVLAAVHARVKSGRPSLYAMAVEL
jgi:hypothetical protein